jgi:hydrogenase expression/formation protein HypC
MCLGVPGKVIEFVDEEHGIVAAEVDGVRRTINAQLLEGEAELAPGEWVLVHLGFAMAKMDERDVEEYYRILEVGLDLPG